jgi:hypothetical protein
MKLSIHIKNKPASSILSKINLNINKINKTKIQQKIINYSNNNKPHQGTIYLIRKM